MKGKFLNRYMAISLVAMFLIVGGTYGYLQFKAFEVSKENAATQSPPQTVSTHEVTTEMWQARILAVGSLVAIEGAELAPELAGTVVAINFNSGDDVQQGDILLGIDSRQEEATLEQLEAQRELAQQTLDRDLKQLRISAVSQQTIDENRSNLKNFDAQVRMQQAIIAKKNIRAPFSGRLGVSLISLGQYLNAGDPFISLQALDELFVDFFLAQRDVPSVKPGLEVVVIADAYPENPTTDTPIKGKVIALDSMLQDGTGNVKVRALFQNPDKVLLPGMYVTVNIDLGAPEEKVTVPQTVVAHNSYGALAYLVVDQNEGKGQPDLIAKGVVVETGETRGDKIEITKGLKAGDTVVGAGQMKLRDGTHLLVNNSVQPTNDPNPKPFEQQ